MDIQQMTLHIKKYPLKFNETSEISVGIMFWSGRSIILTRMYCSNNFGFSADPSKLRGKQYRIHVSIVDEYLMTQYYVMIHDTLI